MGIKNFFKNKFTKYCFVFVPVFLVLIFGTLSSFVSAQSSPPAVINYQGKLLESGASVTSTKNMAFVIYDAKTGGNALYTASGTLPSTSTIGVSPTQGVFNIELGGSSTNPLPSNIFKSNNSLYLEVYIEDTKLTPRKKLTSQPFALNSKYLMGHEASSSPTSSSYVPVSKSDGSFEFSGVAVSSSDNAASTALKINNKGNERFTFLAGGKLGINTSSPVSHLSIKGDSLITGTSTVKNLIANNRLSLNGVSRSNWLWSTNNSENLIYPTDTSKTLLVGTSTTSSPNSALEVDGSSYFQNVDLKNLTIRGDTTGISLSNISGSSTVPYLANDNIFSGINVFNATTTLSTTTFNGGIDGVSSSDLSDSSNLAFLNKSQTFIKKNIFSASTTLATTTIDGRVVFNKETQGLDLNNITGSSTVFYLSKDNTLTGANSFSGTTTLSTTTFNGSISGVSSGDLSDSSSIAYIDRSQTFSKQNTFNGKTIFATTTLDDNAILDMNENEALLVRKDGNGGDVFIVDTNNNEVTASGTFFADGGINTNSGDLILNSASGNVSVSGQLNGVSINEKSTGFEMVGGSSNAKTLSVDITASTSDFLQNLVEDTSPELGGNLNAASNNITNIAELSAGTTTLGQTNISGLIYPTADGSANYTLQTDGNGNLVFERTNLSTSSVTGTLDITTNTNLQVGPNLDLTSGSSDTITVKDNYLFNSGDTATGDYDFSAGTLFVDDSSQRIGVGTTSPNFKFAVNGQGYISSNLRVGNSTEQITTSTFVLDGDDAYVHDNLGVGDQLFVENEVHIGTSSLHLSGDTSGGRVRMTDGSLSIDTYGNNPSSGQPNILNLNSNSNNPVYTGTGSFNINGTLNATSDAFLNTTTIYKTLDVSGVSNFLNQTNIQSSLNISNTTTALGVMNLQNDLSVFGNSDLSTTTILGKLQINNGIDLYGGDLYSSFSTLTLRSAPGTAIQLNRNNGGDIITGSGNVGIGDSNPANKLSVSGKGSFSNGAEFGSQLSFSDSFEDGNLGSGFTTQGAANWFVTNSESSDGSYSAQSGNITHSETTTLRLEKDIASGGGQLSFDYKVSTESNFDYLELYINGSFIDQWSGSINWSTYTTSLNSGTNVIKWTYRKDGAVDGNSDTVWVDNVKLTNTQNGSKGKSATFDGKVGINDTNPSDDLTVSGTSRFTGKSTFESVTNLEGNIHNPQAKGYITSSTAKLGGVRDIESRGDLVYALSETDSSFQIIDVSDKDDIKSLGSITDVRFGAGDYSLELSGQYAYVVSQNSNTGRTTLTVIDITNPSSPSIINSINDSQIGVDLPAIGDMVAKGGFAYMISSDSGSGFYIYDVSNPHDLKLVSKISDSSSTNLEFGEDIEIEKNYVYISAGEGVQIINVSKPRSPKIEGKLGASTGDMDLLNNKIYLAGPDYLEVINVSNPSSLSLVSTSSLEGIPGGIHTSNGYAYIVADDSGTDQPTQGVFIYDISNPSSASLVGSIGNTSSETKFENIVSLSVEGSYIYVAAYEDDAVQAVDVTGAKISNTEIGSANISNLSASGKITAGGGADVYGGLHVGSDGLLITGDFAMDSATTSIYGTNTLKFDSTALFESAVSTTDDYAFMFDTQNTLNTNSTTYLLSLRNGGSPQFSVATNGDVHSTGDMYASSFNTTGNQPGDLAEKVDVVGRDVKPGDVLVVDSEKLDTYRMSEKAYDSTVAGVVSTDPSITIGDGKTSSTAVMAMVGRVPIKVTAQNGPIERGDILVTSDEAGHAMKYDPNNNPDKKSFSSVGIALDSFSAEDSSSTGKIMGLVKSGWVSDYTKTINNMKSEVIKIAQEKGISVNQDPTELTVEQDSGGGISFIGKNNLNLNGGNIFNVSGISGTNNRWAIDTSGRFKTNVDTSDGEKSLYTVQSDDGSYYTFYGSSQLRGGEKEVKFESYRKDIIDESYPIKVNITLTSQANGVYVDEKNEEGFVVKELNDGESNASFDWTVVARRVVASSDTSVEPHAGCMNPDAENYDPTATESDDSCEIPGCIDVLAENYDPDATIGNGSCVYDKSEVIEGCTDEKATNYNSDANKSDGSCKYEEDKQETASTSTTSTVDTNTTTTDITTSTSSTVSSTEQISSTTDKTVSSTEKTSTSTDATSSTQQTNTSTTNNTDTSTSETTKDTQTETSTTESSSDSTKQDESNDTSTTTNGSSAATTESSTSQTQDSAQSDSGSNDSEPTSDSNTKDTTSSTAEETTEQETSTNTSTSQ